MLPRFLLALLFLSLPLHAGNHARDVLDEINLARTQPAQYAQVVAAQAGRVRGIVDSAAITEAVRFLHRAQPLPPLAWSSGIANAALSHALEVGSRGGHGHRGSRGDMPWHRMARFGKWKGYAGENIDYGRNDARSIVIALIVDQGVPSRMHRENLFNRNFGVTGVAVAPHARHGVICVMDFASSFRERGEERIAGRTDPGYRSKYSGMSFF